MNERPRLGVITAFDPRNRRAASGTTWYMARALERQLGAVSFLGPLFSWTALAGRMLNRIARRGWGGHFAYQHRLALARRYGALVRRRLRPDLDLLIAPTASTEIALLETALPIIYTSDATFDLLKDYYPEYSGYDGDLLAQGQEIERRAIRRANLLIYPSRWAADSAIGTYGADPARVHVLPYGANLDAAPDPALIDPGAKWKARRLVFIGGDWERKGGPVVYQALGELRRGGIPAELVIIGCRPTLPDLTGVRMVGPLDKADPTQQARLVEELLNATLLVQPVRHECYGVVFCEASACGTPALAAATGGVAGAVHEGLNGHLLRRDAAATEYAARIAQLLRDEAAYRCLSASARQLFDTSLNWDRWAADTARLARPLLSSAPSWSQR